MVELVGWLVGCGLDADDNATRYDMTVMMMVVMRGVYLISPDTSYYATVIFFGYGVFPHDVRCQTHGPGPSTAQITIIKNLGHPI